MRLPIHGYYFVVPLVTAAFWLTCIVGLLGLWRMDHFKQYEYTEADVVFISDVGAAHHAYFIVFCCLTSVAYMITTLLERHLRHQRRIPGSIRHKQTSLDIASIVFAFIGALALIFLSIFDAFDYSTAHWSCTVVFVVFVAISVFLQTWMIFSMAIDHDGKWSRILRRIAVLKTCLLSFAIACAIGFVVGYAICSGDAYPGDSMCNRSVSVAAVFEWIVSFVLFFFFLTYTVDLWPAKKSAEKGLTEDDSAIADPSLAHEAGTDKNHPTAAYVKARDMGPDHSQQEYANGGATDTFRGPAAGHSTQASSVAGHTTPLQHAPAGVEMREV